MSIYHFFSTRPLPRAPLALFRAKGATFTGAHNGTPAYLSIAEHFEHVGVERFNGLVMAREDLFLDGAQVQRVRHLLVVMAVPKNARVHKKITFKKCPSLQTCLLKRQKLYATNGLRFIPFP